MRRPDIGSAIRRTTNDDRDIDQPTGHIADTTGVINDLVKRDIGKTPEHQFDYRPKAKHRGADSHPDKSGFADRCIDQALVAIFFPKTFGDLVRAIVLGHLFSEDQDVLVAFNFFGQGIFERFTVGN